jgi:hypothetical protein
MSLHASPNAPLCSDALSVIVQCGESLRAVQTDHTEHKRNAAGFGSEWEVSERSDSDVLS